MRNYRDGTSPVATEHAGEVLPMADAELLMLFILGAGRAT